MKRIWKLMFFGMLCSPLCAMAQESLPRKDIATPTPALSAAAAYSPGATPTPIPQSALALIPQPLPSPADSNTQPQTAPVMPDLSKLDQIFKTTTPGKEVELYRAHVEWRKLKNRTVNDPAVVSAKAAAEAATTDLEKRKLLRIYYELFYTRMRALASTPEIATYLDSMKDSHLALLDQPRVRPTPDTGKKPSPTPSPDQSALPTPEPSLPPALPEPTLPNE